MAWLHQTGCSAAAGGAVLTLWANVLWWGRGQGRGSCGMHLSLCGQQEAVT